MSDKKEKDILGFEVINMSAIDDSILNQNTKQYTYNGIVKYGIDDQEFDNIIEEYLLSPTNNSIINNASRLIYAKGLNIEIMDNDELRKVVKDFYLFGNASIQIVDGKYFHIPVNFLRSEEVDEQGRILNYYYSTDWSDLTIDPTIIPNWEYDKRSRMSVFYIKQYTPKAFYYNLPSYISGRTYARIEILLADYNIDQINNGFSGIKLINYNNGIPSAEVRRTTVQQVHQKLTGVNGEKVIISFNKDKESAVTIEDISVDNAVDKYAETAKQASSMIIRSHGVTSPLLLGIRDTNGFSSNSDEMAESNLIYMNNVIKPYQSFLQDCLIKLSGIEGLYFLNEGDEIKEDNQLSDMRLVHYDYLDIDIYNDDYIKEDGSLSFSTEGNISKLNKLISVANGNYDLYHKFIDLSSKTFKT